MMNVWSPALPGAALKTRDCRQGAAQWVSVSLRQPSFRKHLNLDLLPEADIQQKLLVHVGFAVLVILPALVEGSTSE